MPLTEQQKEIVEATGKPIVVLAGPGTGKTQVLAHRLLLLLRSNLATKNELVGITFTRKAAGQMEKRVGELGLTDDQQPLICTLHSLAARILRENEETAEVPTGFNVADEYESLLVLEDAIEDINPRFTKRPKTVLDEIILLKSKRKKPEDLSNGHWLKSTYKRYQELLRFHKALDFEDLILQACSLLEENEPVRAIYEVRCKNLLVDEFQDINHAEYALVKLLAGKGGGLFVLGDDDQSIYSWRGADPNIILRFTDDYKSAEQRIMTTCFRCPDTIILGALGLVANNSNRVHKKVEPVDTNCEPIKILHCKSDVQEAKWIGNWVSEKVKRREYEPKDIAILCRAGDIADKIADQIEQASIPIARPSPKATQRVREFIAYLRLVADRGDSLALRVCLGSSGARGIGRKAVKKLRECAEDENCDLWDSLIIAQKEQEFTWWHTHLKAFAGLIEKLNADLSKLTLSKFLVNVAEALGYETEPRIIELIRTAENLPDEYTLYSFISDVRGARGEKSADAKQSAEGEENAVLLVTMHSVKGLQSDVIFVVGMEKGSFPQLRGNIEEERRLCYVAMTRARKELFLCYAKKREGRSAQGFNFFDPSRFIFEIPKRYTEHIRASSLTNGDDKRLVLKSTKRPLTRVPNLDANKGDSKCQSLRL